MDNTVNPPDGFECLHYIASHMPDPLFVVDGGMNITFRNSAAEKLLESITGYGCPEALRGGSGRCTAYAVERAFSTGEVQRTHAECGRNVYGAPEIVVAPLRDIDGNASECLVMVRDHSASRESDQRRRDMLSMLSHDIRTPVTMIHAYADTLLEPPSQLVEEDAAFLHRIKELSHAAAVLLDDFVTLSRLDCGSVEIAPEPVSVKVLVSLTLGQLRQIAAESSADIQTNIADGLPDIVVDLDWFGRVISNVVLNAVRHSQRGVKILISASEDRDAGGVMIEIADDGPGIPQEDLPHVFERYYRSSRGKKTEGHGLGLMIVKTITELHGGKVCAESRPGRGTTLRLRLPSAPSTP